MTQKDKKKTGIALGGGAVLGGAHIGVIRALEEKELRPDCIAGTSIGALIACLYAFGIGWEKMKQIALDLNWLDVSGFTLSKYGLLSNDRIGDVISDVIGDVSFGDAKIPLAVVSTDISSGERVVLKEGSVIEAVKASTCIPGVFIPIEKDNRMLIDGGLMENVPVLALEELGAEYIIGVDLNANYLFSKPGNLVELLINTVHLGLHHITEMQIEKADLMIQPDLSEFNYVQMDQLPELIERGYEAAMSGL
jgi:NTE family protein